MPVVVAFVWFVVWRVGRDGCVRIIGVIGRFFLGSLCDVGGLLCGFGSWV